MSYQPSRFQIVNGADKEIPKNVRHKDFLALDNTITMSDRNSGNGQIDGEVPLKNMARVNQGQENELNEDPENGMVKDNRRNDK